VKRTTDRRRYRRLIARVYEHIRGAGPFVFIAGQTPELDSGEVPDDIGAQVFAAVDKIAAALAGRELSLANVVKMTYFLTEIGELEQVRTALDAVLSQPWPTASLVEVSGLVDPRFRIEIEAIAYRG
jgi:2-iminobutanoate/2-iminopropanoate deaminase